MRELASCQARPPVLIAVLLCQHSFAHSSSQLQFEEPAVNVLCCMFYTAFSFACKKVDLQLALMFRRRVDRCDIAVLRQEATRKRCATHNITFA
jgi:hypothetical protein